MNHNQQYLIVMQPQNKLYVPECLYDKFVKLKEQKNDDVANRSCLILDKPSENMAVRNRYIIALPTQSDTIISEKAIKNKQIKTIVRDKNYAQIIIVNYKQINKQQITVCSSQAVNQELKKYVIINFSYTRISGINHLISGYELSHTTRKSSLKSVLQSISQQWKRVWDNYTKIYTKLAQKVNKNTKNKDSLNLCDLMPMLQFEVNPILAPNNINKNGITQISQFYQEFSVLIDISNFSQISEVEQQEISKKITQQLNNSLNQNNAQMKINNIPHKLSVHRFAPTKIFNPHIFAKPQSKQKYQLFLTRGCYQFYHYGDQKFNDNGWGCAYRAFQTLYSWLHTQGYTKPLQKMISIVDIQEKIDMIDFSRKLKGSNKWIGATEVSWLVSRLTIPEINCKILHVSDGKQILDKCQELKNHFLTTGSPIMYGGGQYAYSIVGMYYNWKFGQCQFLILDPHYTGEDDYATILEKKGLAWRKPQEMFKKGVFYNFCLPIIK